MSEEKLENAPIPQKEEGGNELPNALNPETETPALSDTNVENKVSVLNGVNNVNVELVWEPQWDRDMMSEEAKLQLGML